MNKVIVLKFKAVCVIDLAEIVFSFTIFFMNLMNYTHNNVIIYLTYIKNLYKQKEEDV